MDFTRRTFLKGAMGTITAGTLFRPKLSHATNPKVISIYDADCTTWAGGFWWGSDTYVNQTRIDNMVSEGIKRLTGQSVELDAWTSLFPTVTGSTKVGIKVNENNLGTALSTNAIDWLPQVINATIRGLKVRGFTEPNIYVMDPSGRLPDAFTDIVYAHYPGVLFWSGNGVGRGLACTWDSADSSLTVTHTNTSYGTSKLPDQLLDLTYLIQMPIMKLHYYYQYTLTYKNLLGMKDRDTIYLIHAGSNDASNNILADLYANTNIIDKTKLIIGDGIYGGRTDNLSPPTAWSIFGNTWPKRVFFSSDPVAIDSVMWDFINWQSMRSEHNAISNAATREHGIHDHWNNPTEKRYSLIDFVQLDMGNLDNLQPAPPKNLKIIP